MQISTQVHGKFQENLDNFANWADDALPDWVLIDNEIHYYLNFKTFEVVYYMCQGFCEAHVEAEHKLANYYGDTHVPDSPEEIKVCLESARKREAAKTILSTVDPRLVEMIKNNIVAENLLELEYNYIVKVRGVSRVASRASHARASVRMEHTRTRARPLLFATAAANRR